MTTKIPSSNSQWLNEIGGILKRPTMGFAFCYMLSHYGLDLIDDEQCEKILIYIENNLNELENKIKT